MSTPPSSVPNVALNDGHAMPQLGFGVWQVGSDEAIPAIAAALEAGYRSIDTAMIYGNEEGVGEALRASELAREELFVTTKLWNPDQGRAAEALDESLARLGQESIDLYLIHWPTPKQDRYAEAWATMVELQKAGKTRSIGVSNFTIDNLKRIIAETGVTPAVNQIELHPRLPQAELRAFHAEHGIVTESWSPLGQGKLTEDPTLVEIGRKYGKTAAQVILRWHIELGLVAIPKSVTPSRIQENFDIFDFALDAEDMAAIAKLETGERMGGNPETANYGVS
ncbi:aldo/keto reductase [bacterium]|nr:MAG: aldo/keto reductase [bacterium]